MKMDWTQKLLLAMAAFVMLAGAYSIGYLQAEKNGLPSRLTQVSGPHRVEPSR